MKFKTLLASLLVAFVLIAAAGCSRPDGVSDKEIEQMAQYVDDKGNIVDENGKIVQAGKTDNTKVGFLFVGGFDDFGYNQAAYLGSIAVEKAFPDVDVIRAENVPESAEVERKIEEMIRSGAKIIFPTSYGYLPFVLNVAKKHPDIIFYHQGGLESSDNVGTYFASIWKQMYLSGVAAGKMTKTGKLGFVASVPIEQVLLNINAFTMGARSVNPNATTSVVFTNSWCEPAEQVKAANQLIGSGVDIISQHQDCTTSIVETALKSNVKVVGYHADASKIGKSSWISGGIWDWGNAYIELVKTAKDGGFKSSRYAGVYQFPDSFGAAKLAEFGPAVPEDVKQIVKSLEPDLISGNMRPFTGPIKDNEGNIKVPAGTVVKDEDIMSGSTYLVEGVIGKIAK
ncbi:BMP family ABC transporter substrate-binding protein [Paenibacillus ginsengarvi]|uniref:BMP family ABC transporter substrate-binding protein n=1 Tax=Paenibacillus ginsengarvi TaxID=400777 RepID=A0A3B0C1V9_9BACL|nr:BMP family ABC transporter substrate-binding protein [Paenibacillus ginsengarvi]RKN79242.1 BMP family ABC transporter substrate-binding protein [Paenibacillus ginsengarvi]